MGNGLECEEFCQWSFHGVYPLVHGRIPMHQIMFEVVMLNFSSMNWFNPSSYCFGSANVVFFFSRYGGIFIVKVFSLNCMFNFRPQIPTALEGEST